MTSEERMKHIENKMEYSSYLINEMLYLWKCQGAKFKSFEDFVKDKEDPNLDDNGLRVDGN